MSLFKKQPPPDPEDLRAQVTLLTKALATLADELHAVHGIAKRSETRLCKLMTAQGVSPHHDTQGEKQ